MAGSWPDTPSRKIAYHADGTVVVGRYPPDGAPYENFYPWDPTSTGLEELNDLDFSDIDQDWANGRFPAIPSNAADPTNKRAETCWIFPELRDIYGYAFVLHGQNNGIGGPGEYTWYISADTTNGVDGTWTNIGDFDETNLTTGNYPEAWRESQIMFYYPAARAMRCLGVAGFFTGGPTVWRAAFLFGVIAAGETPDRILFIDDYTGLEFTGPMDWGDVPRGSELEWDIYLLNNSATLTANTMTLDMKTLYDVSDTWYSMNEAGGAFGSTISVSSMAAGARYPTGTDVITIKLEVPDDQPLSIYEAFLELSAAASWT